MLLNGCLIKHKTYKMNKLNEKIQEWLALNHLTQVEFAKEIGVTKATVNQWVKGYTKPTPAHEKNIALLYPELNIYWLWGKDEHITRKMVLKPIEKTHIDNILMENQHLKNQITTQEMLITALKDQLEMYKLKVT